MLKISFALFLLFMGLSSFSQEIEIRRATSSIVIDGVLDDAAWAFVDSAYDFKQYFPYDTSLAVAQRLYYTIAQARL